MGLFFHEKNMKGFSLIELSIVLIISGLFLTIALNLWQQSRNNEASIEIKEKFNFIRLALSDYTFDNPSEDDPVRFPCPAPLNVPKDDPAYGFEFCPWKDKEPEEVEKIIKNLKPGDVVNGIYVLGSPMDKPITKIKTKAGKVAGLRKTRPLVLLGALPASTLQIPQNNMHDPYGNFMMYAVTLELTLDGALLEQPPRAGSIQVINGLDAGITNTARFFIYSAGEDRAGGFSDEGHSSPQKCRKGIAGDALNCNWQARHYAAFRIQDGFSHASNEDYYDDWTMFRLFSQKDFSGWWTSIDESGKDIVTKNEGALFVGIPDEEVTVEQDKLVVGGNVRADRFTIRHEEKSDSFSEEAKCEEEHKGTVRYEDGEIELCNGRDWKEILTGGFKCPGKQVLKGIGKTGRLLCEDLPPCCK